MSFKLSSFFLTKSNPKCSQCNFLVRYFQGLLVPKFKFETHPCSHIVNSKYFNFYECSKLKTISMIKFDRALIKCVFGWNRSVLCSQYSVLLSRSLSAPRLKYPKLQVKLKCNPYLGGAGKWWGAVQRLTPPPPGGGGEGGAHHPTTTGGRCGAGGAHHPTTTLAEVQHPPQSGRTKSVIFASHKCTVSLICV